MDRPFKRRRLHHESSSLELDQKRARHDLHLKSRFEAIFRKYGKDFSETADEIDLETGEIVVNKGHLATMVDETDPGQNLNSSSHQQLNRRTAADDLDPQYSDWINSEEGDVAPVLSLNSTTEAITGPNSLLGDRMVDSTNSLRGKPFDGQSCRNGKPDPHCRGTDIRSHREEHHSLSPNGHHTNGSTIESSDEASYLGTRWDRPALEPAWQAPPLAEDRLRKFSRPKLLSISLDESNAERSPSPPMGSLWAPMAGRKRPRKVGTARQRRRRPPRPKPLVQLERSVFALSMNQHEGDQPYVSSRRHPKRWTREEEDLLIDLKTNTQLTYLQMEPYFPGRKRRHLGCHWSQTLRCGERITHQDGDSTEELTEPIESKGKTKLQGGLPSLHKKDGAPLVLKNGARKQSNLDLKGPSKTLVGSYSSSRLSPKGSKQLVAATLDYTDELGDYPLEDRLTAVGLSKSSPIVARSRPGPLVNSSEELKHRQAPTPRYSKPQAKKQNPLNRTPFNKMQPLGSKDELSDSCELGLSPPRNQASAPSFRVRPFVSAGTLVPFRTRKEPSLLHKATSTPRPTAVEDSSEDELATPVKTIGTPQGPTTKLVGSIRRRTSHW